MPNQFQNTLAYTQLYSSGGIFTLGKVASKFRFTPTILENKNFNIESDLGGELVTNGDFATDTDWNKGIGITISGGSANFSGNSNANINQNIGLVSGTKYRATFTISNYVSGDIDINVGGATRQGSYSGNGDYTIDVISSSGATLYFQENNTGVLGFTGSIDNVSVKEIFLTNDFAFEVTQTGAYFVDFSFIARGGIDATINLVWYKNGVLLDKYKSVFYQQTSLDYEVSNNFIINLTQYDTMYPALLRVAGIGAGFSTIDIKLNSFNLQQLGIH